MRDTAWFLLGLLTGFGLVSYVLVHQVVYPEPLESEARQ